LTATLLVAPLCSWAQEDAEGVPDTTRGLLAIKRLCVEKFAGEEPQAEQAREMAIASLFATKRFALTENCEKADAVLKGAVAEAKEQRVRAEGEGMEFGTAAGAASVSGSSGSAAVGAARGASSETLVSSETLTQASVTLRIVDKDGDILWAHTEENKGAKTKTPIGFSLGRAVKALLREIERGEKKKTTRPG